MPNLEVIDFVTLASLPQHISENSETTDYFIIDLPGARNPLLATAVGLSDHVLIPIQGCAMDAAAARRCWNCCRIWMRRQASGSAIRWC